MRVLFVSGELIAGNLAYRLKQEGCDVKLFIKDKSRKDCFDNMIAKTDDWEKELPWVGKKGLIVFDDVNFGQIQDKLRKQGYMVVGGSAGGDKLEIDREFGQSILSRCGLKNILGTINFPNIKSAIRYVKNNPVCWVVKQNGHLGVFDYVGKLKDGSDVLSILENYDAQNLGELISVSLQKKVEGIEIGVARYFNGRDWVGPIEFNIEHKRFLNGDIGPLTSEMGTVMWYREDENIKLFKNTLAKVKNFLREIDFRGDVDIDCIINKDNCYPLELTARFGSPAIHLQMEMHRSPWQDFLSAVASGQNFDLKYKKGFGVVVCVTVPPFPYISYSSMYSKFYSKGTKIIFDKLSEEEKSRVHFEEVKQKIAGKNRDLYIAGANGYILYITGEGKTPLLAIKRTYDLIDKIIIPKMIYRTDIGKKFMERDKAALESWGWI